MPEKAAKGPCHNTTHMHELSLGPWCTCMQGVCGVYTNGAQQAMGGMNPTPAFLG